MSGNWEVSRHTPGVQATVRWGGRRADWACTASQEFILYENTHVCSTTPKEIEVQKTLHAAHSFQRTINRSVRQVSSICHLCTCSGFSDQAVKIRMYSSEGDEFNAQLLSNSDFSERCPLITCPELETLRWAVNRCGCFYNTDGTVHPVWNFSTLTTVWPGPGWSWPRVHPHWQRWRGGASGPPWAHMWYRK